MATANEIDALEAEFAQVTAVRDAQVGEKGKLLDRDPRFSPIRYVDAYKRLREHAKEDDETSWKKHQQALQQNHPHQPSGCFFSFFETGITKSLHDDRDFVFCITSTSSGRDHLAFTWDDETHCRIASTVYKKLCDLPPHAPVNAVGSHWQTLGFQGPNFNNDAGRLGALFVLLQMLYFVDNAPRLAKASYVESRPPTMRQFSWALWSIFCSTRTVDAFSKKKLNGLINKHKNVMEVLNLYYLGVFSELYETWCSEEKREEMHEFNQMKKDMTAWCMSKPEQVIKKARTAMVKSHDKAKATVTSGPPPALTDMREIEDKKDDSD
eukprot:TRINITY_DN44036_c0_g1_i1.p1 TRINITY_DN44036_c0_g1~~TRINITY_DN44036_c0_g1_i1.p1  ORF type:complete len:357 (+),score=111.12 TRINITY_DN44036_c0_g1_i1:100-1071(+)